MHTEIQNEEMLLRSLPDSFILSFDGFELLKSVESAGKKRNVYFKASDESLDMQNDSVMMSALEESKDYFLSKGNFDYGHYSKLPISVLMGMELPNMVSDEKKVRVPRMFEIGQPSDVHFDKKQNGTFVKGVIYENNSLADWFWSTLSFDPPMRWFPSIGGATLQKAIEIDGNGHQCARIKKVRWSNIGFTQEPINANGVGNVTTMPIGKFFKSFESGITMEKAMASANIAPLVKEDLEGKAGNSLPEILKRRNVYYPILKGHLIKNRNLSEEKADDILTKFFGQQLLNTN